MVRTMSSSQWCWASKKAVTSGVVIRGARFPYNTDKMAEVEKRRIESKKPWPAKEVISWGLRGVSSHLWASEHLVHQLRGFSVLSIEMISARRLCQNFACTSPETTPLVIWRNTIKLNCSPRSGGTDCSEMPPCGSRQLFLARND